MLNDTIKWFSVNKDLVVGYIPSVLRIGCVFVDSKTFFKDSVVPKPHASSGTRFMHAILILFIN